MQSETKNSPVMAYVLVNLLYTSLFTIIMVAQKEKKQIYSQRLKREQYTANLTKKANVHRECT